MKRREFIALLGGAAVSSPLVARAQQPDRMRRIGILQNLPDNDPVASALVAAFLKELQQLGWTVGSNISVETRWAGTASDGIRRHATELVALAPDVILTNGTSTLGPLLQQSKTIPIVFVQVTDPVGSGYVSSLARPGGNATGFAAREYGVSGKWLEVLKQIAPAVRRVGIIRHPAVPSGSGQFGAIQAVAPYLGVEVTPIDVRTVDEIERMVGALANSPNSGLVITANGAAVAHRSVIIALAARHKLPAVYWQRHFVEAGGLVSYGEDGTDQYRRSLLGRCHGLALSQKNTGSPVAVIVACRAISAPLSQVSDRRICAGSPPVAAMTASPTVSESRPVNGTRMRNREVRSTSVATAVLPSLPITSRVAPAHCCAGAPSELPVRLSPQAAQASPGTVRDCNAVLLRRRAWCSRWQVACARRVVFSPGGPDLP